MSDKELVKRLRGWAKDIQEGSTAIYAMDLDLKNAASSIEALTEQLEALTAERDMATEGWAEATRLIDVARQQYGAEKSRAEAAEAKLAKAVEALGIIKDRQYYRMGPGITAQVIARTTLAEIEGSDAP
jgi:septal ring factor EnvC (AmiA/AmiB activator)